MPNNPKNQKEEARATLLRHLGLPKGTRATMLSYIQDPDILAFFRSACGSLGIILITDITPDALAGADIWITDILRDTIPMQDLAKNRVVPVVPTSGLAFNEFDPMKFLGNAFIFETVDQFQMLEKLIRALENMRYAGDKRMLLENISQTKFII